MAIVPDLSCEERSDYTNRPPTSRPKNAGLYHAWHPILLYAGKHDITLLAHDSDEEVADLACELWDLRKADVALAVAQRDALIESVCVFFTPGEAG